MSVEQKLCNGMGYEHCVLFSAARVAIAHYVRWQFAGAPVFIPSNVCPALANAIGDPVLLPVSATSGLSEPGARVIVQLYGCRKGKDCELEIDPLMSGWRLSSIGRSIIISFGYSKTINIGYGGAFLTNNLYIAQDMKRYSDWCRDDKTEQLDYELDRLDEVIKRRKERMALWDLYLPEWCIKPDIEPVMPWRVIRRISGSYNRDYLADGLRRVGFNVGTNYPPLPGCTDPSSMKWGKEVVNFWLDDDPVKARGVLDRMTGL
jgi:hypothetical protein